MGRPSWAHPNEKVIGRCPSCCGELLRLASSRLVRDDIAGPTDILDADQDDEGVAATGKDIREREGCL